MITISTDRGLERIENFDDISAIPGYAANVDPKSVKLQAIIGSYNEADFVRCGLSTCHREHGKGYLVTTVDGRVTNIGKDCGKTHFGVDFEDMQRRFDRDLQDAERRENLKTFQRRIPELNSRIKALRDGDLGADWIYRTIQTLTTPGRGLPVSIVDLLRKVRLSRDPTLTKPRFATKSEIQAVEIRERRKIEGPYYIDEPVARLEGIDALFPENDLRELLAVGLQGLLDEVKSLNVDSLASAELRSNVARVTGTDAFIRRAESAIAAGRLFLKSDNLKPLLEFAEGASEAGQVQRFLHSLRSAVPSRRVTAGG